MLRYVVVNADDFGLSSGINQGIIEGFKKGIVTSASICVNGCSFEEAALLAKQNIDLDIGLHIVLIEEKPLLSAKDIRSLVNNHGLFFRKNYQFLLRYFLGMIRREDIEKEIRAQFKKAFDSGLKITHVDSHRHSHILPGVLNMVIKLCQEYKIPSIRYPYEPLTFKRMLLNYKNVFRTALQLLINITSLFSIKIIKKNSINICKGCYGLLDSGDLNVSAFKRIISSLKEGIYEIISHPALVDKELLSKYKHWGYNWQIDLSTLTSNEVKNFINENKIKIINFKYAVLP